MESMEEIVARVNIKNDSAKEYEQKFYRYTGLIHAIEFFSQRFSLDNILQYVFDFTNELLLLEKSAIFYLDEKTYVQGLSKGFSQNKGSFPYERKYDEIVLFHAGLIKNEEFYMFFDETICQDFNADYAIPLIMDKSLFGVVFVQKTEAFSVDDLIIAEALMNLYSTSLTNFQTITDLEIVRRELDEKIFNLFAINQSSKALLSVLEINQLFDLALSVFSELTQSSITSFFLHDEISETYKLTGIIDVFAPKNSSGQCIYVANKNFKFYKTVIDYHNERELKEFTKLFVGSEAILDQFKPYYIITLAQDGHLFGFVTLSEKVNNIPYDKGVFELIESLASSTYIAFQNAKQLIKINNQSLQISQKLERLQSLNRLMQNINAAQNLDSLLDLTLKTLEISYHFNCCIAAVYDKTTQSFKVVQSKGIDLVGTMLENNGNLEALFEGESVQSFSTIDTLELLSLDEDGYEENNIQGFIGVPIYIDDIELEIIGFIGVLGVEKGQLHSGENLVTIETICHHIAPVSRSLSLVSEIKEHYSENTYKKFNVELAKQMSDAQKFDLYFEIIHCYDTKKFSRVPGFSLELIEHPNSILVDHQNLFVIHNDKTLFDSIRLSDSFEKSRYIYRQDFDNLDELFSILNK